MEPTKPIQSHTHSHTNSFRRFFCNNSDCSDLPAYQSDFIEIFSSTVDWTCNVFFYSCCCASVFSCHLTACRTLLLWRLQFFIEFITFHKSPYGPCARNSAPLSVCLRCIHLLLQYKICIWWCKLLMLTTKWDKKGLYHHQPTLPSTRPYLSPTTTWHMYILYIIAISTEYTHKHKYAQTFFEKYSLFFFVASLLLNCRAFSELYSNKLK